MNLTESLLFGHKKGSFTGAISDYVGAFERAGDGLLLFDDLDKLDPLAQAKILRPLRERCFTPVGGKEEIPVRCRIAAASKVPLGELQETGRLLEDLRYRLEVDTIIVPLARERPLDVLAVVIHALRAERPTADLDSGARAAILRFDFPGNMGEADAVGKSLGHLGKDLIGERDVQARLPALLGRSFPKGLSAILDHARTEAVMREVVAARGDVSAAAKVLGISRATAYGILQSSALLAPSAEPPEPRQLTLGF